MIKEYKLMEPLSAAEKCLDSQLWGACAGTLVRIPVTGSTVYYFPQGHAEHAQVALEEFGQPVPVGPMILCKVYHIKYMADSESDEVYAKVKLVPTSDDMLVDSAKGCSGGLYVGGDGQEGKRTHFAKTLTQSDANNGGGFSVPRYCAETIFPRLDYSAEPPVQTILAKDVHGEVWKFRHIYRGTPRRHLLTTGWSNFVNQKKLVAGDSIVFLRAENEELCVGIRRARRGIGGGSDCSTGWSCVKLGDNKMTKKDGSIKRKGKARAEAVLEAANLAAAGQPFEVIYYPRAGTPEFIFPASEVRAAMRIQWCPGIRFKMAFETEDSSRISWFLGTVSSVQVADPINWPNSPWRILQVNWDEPELLRNVKSVCPWLAEVVSNMPSIYFSHFSPPRKKMKIHQLPDFPTAGHLAGPSFTGKPTRLNTSLVSAPGTFQAGIQGARHAPLIGFSTQDRLPFEKLQSDFSPLSFHQKDPIAGTRNLNFFSNEAATTSKGSGNLESPSKDSTRSKKPTHIVLFGKRILPDEQSMQRGSADANGHSSSDGSPEKILTLPDASSLSGSQQNGQTDNLSDEVNHKSVLGNPDEGRQTLDLWFTSSGKLPNVFSLEA